MKILLILGASLCCMQLAVARSYKSKAIVEGDIGGPCEYDDDCMTNNAYCKSGRSRQCGCKQGFDFNEPNDECLPTKLGLKCASDYDCSSFINAQCKERICVCRQGYVSQGDVACLPTSRLMATCQTDEQCVAADQFSWCNTTSSLCSCMPSYHQAYDTQSCVPNKRIRDACNSDSDCANASDQQDKVQCRSDDDGRRKCFCREGYGEGQANGISICAQDFGGAAAVVVSTAILVTASVAAFIL